MGVFSRALQERDLQVGDHIWYHVRKFGKLIQHHGIWVGNGVIHFDAINADADYACCDACRDRPNGRTVRFSCLTCWRLGNGNCRYYLCEYGKGLSSLLMREMGSRSRESSHSGDSVAAIARWFYHNKNFGHYEVLTHNCEDFARFCKIRKLGSKQVLRAIAMAGIFGLGKTMVAAVGFTSVRNYNERKLCRLIKSM